jgi:alginate O-acetyltransferase complex protein AlgJ
MNDVTDTPTQTPAQWAVRWHGVVLAALLLASVPIVHLCWHGLLGHGEPLIRSRGQATAPAPTLANVQDGSWMLAKERELREASPVAWWLRSSWNEALFRAGAPRSRQVHVGGDDWFFLQATVAPDRARFDRRVAVRRNFFTAVRDRVRATGAELVVLVVPDKARVYPEFAFAGGALPAAKATTYRDVLGELGALGIATVDVDAALAAARAGSPGDDLYFRHDTHWRPTGALIAARAAALAIEGGPLAAQLSPRRQVELFGKESIRMVGDLTAMLGLATVEVGEPGSTHAVPMSLLTERLAETRDYHGIALREGGRSLPLYGDSKDAEILVAGTSFSEENGWKALSLALGRPVRAVLERGAGGTEPARAVVRELERGARPKLVIWEFVERGLFEDEWRAPEL